MTDVEGGIDYAKFELSLVRLEEQYEHLRRDIDGLPDWIVEGVKESVTQKVRNLLRHLLEIAPPLSLHSDGSWRGSKWTQTGTTSCRRE